MKLSSEAEPRGCLQKSVLKSFAKFIGKHLCRSFFFNKFEATLIKRDVIKKKFSENSDENACDRVLFR